MASRSMPPSDLARGIRAGDRATLARAITLIESKRADHRKTAHHLVQELLPLTGKSVRLGITGAPGAGNPPQSTCWVLISPAEVRRSRCLLLILRRPAPAARSLATKREWHGFPLTHMRLFGHHPLREHLVVSRPRHAKPCLYAKPPATMW